VLETEGRAAHTPHERRDSQRRRILHGEFHGLSQCRRCAQEQGGLEAIAALAPAIAAVRLIEVASGGVDMGASVCERIKNMRNE
jgi:hypothetical protein